MPWILFHVVPRTLLTEPIAIDSMIHRGCGRQVLIILFSIDMENIKEMAPRALIHQLRALSECFKGRIFLI